MLEIFDMELNEFGKRANPILWIATKQDVPDVEPCLNPRALKLANVVVHFDRCE